MADLQVVCAGGIRLSMSATFEFQLGKIVGAKNLKGLPTNLYDMVCWNIMIWTGIYSGSGFVLNSDHE